MDIRFLRDEAARFRGMAEESDREATRLRLLAMAVDYDTRANAAAAVMKPVPEAAVIEADDLPDEAPSPERALSRTLSIKPTRGTKETVVIARRPVGRPRRE